MPIFPLHVLFSISSFDAISMKCIFVVVSVVLLVGEMVLGQQHLIEIPKNRWAEIFDG